MPVYAKLLRLANPIFPTSLWIRLHDRAFIMDFEQARQRSEEKLTQRIEDIRCGRAPQALEPFAKAYLGMFLEIDDEIAPADRIEQLAAEPLASAIRAGFIAVLASEDLPTPEDIGRRFARGERLALGYVILAGVDLLASNDPPALYELPPETLASALCFYHINTPSHHFDWVAGLLRERADVCVAALDSLWNELLPTVSDHLPGLRQVLREPGAQSLRRQLVLPVLARWKHCKPTVLRELLLVSLRCAGHDALLDLIRATVADIDEAEVKKWIYWLACGYMLAPAEFEQKLTDYAGRWREKTLPLLDFSVAVLAQEQASALQIGAGQIAHLLRIIAPTFRRNSPLTGGVDAVSAKVMELFERLANDSSEAAVCAVRDLQQVRVMRVYADVLEEVASRQRQ